MNVTYLFGAGASCNCLPTYANFYSRFSQFLKFISEQSSSTSAIEINGLLEALNSLKKEFLFHNTPDTIAKKYFHLGDTKKLNQLKNSLIVFFIYEQSLGIKENEEKKIIDKRYDSFIAAILKPIPSSINLLDNIHILTWNYDLQFEICFSKYSDQSIPTVQEVIQSYPKIDSDSYDNYQIQKFSLVHLNGIAFPHSNNFDDVSRIGNFFDPGVEFVAYLSALYKRLQSKRGANRLLKFAWENMNHDFSLKESIVFEKAILVAEETEILVINGYSFPAFNREVDKSIFQKMNNLRTIYIQSPQANDIENIIKNDLIDEKSDFPIFKNLGFWNQFYIPSEWSKKYDPFVGDIQTI